MTDTKPIADLIADLDHPDKPAIRAAVDALIRLASDSPDARQLLNRRLSEPGHKNYWPAAYILGHFRDASAAVLQTLIEALDHRDPDIRWAVALLLVRLIKTDGSLVRFLTDLCASGTANQKRMALYCLRDLALTDPVSLAAMLRGLRDADASVRVAAAISLRLRPDVDEAGKNLLLEVYLEDTESKVRHTAAIALATLGAPSARFLFALTAASESADDQTKKAALAALELLKKEGPLQPAASRDR